MAIPVRAILTNMAVGETPEYRLLAKDPRKVPEAEYLQRVSEKSGIEPTRCRFVLDNARDVLFKGLAANETFDLGFLYAKLYPSGTIPSLTAQPTKAANPVKGRVFFKGDFARKLRELDLVNETLTVDPILYEVYQDGASDRNRIESVTARVVINGNRIKIAAEQEDNGIWLESLKTGEKLVDATVSYSDSATCDCTFPELPPTGKYRLVLATRNGQSPDEYVLARATRNVFVVNGGSENE